MSDFDPARLGGKMNNIGLTDSEMRLVIESLRLARSELERLKPKGYSDTLKQTKALLECLELNVRMKNERTRAY